MRIALISTGERGEGPAPVVAGRSLVLRQLDFAIACGAEKVIAYGNGVDEDAQALAQAARRAGVHATTITSAHALIAVVGIEDSLLVLQPGLLPEAGAAIAAMDDEAAVLALPPHVADEGGFERIDATSFWAGVLVIPGEMVGRLVEIPEDSDPHAALLRIALQQSVARTTLDPGALHRGAWARLSPDRRPARPQSDLAMDAGVERGANGADDAAIADLLAMRLHRIEPRAGSPLLSRRLARLVVKRFAEPLLAFRASIAVAVALAGLLLCAAPLAAWSSLPALAFACIAIGVLVFEISFGLERLKAPAFRRPRLPHFCSWLPDIALFATTIIAIDGEWYRRLFPAIVLLASLRAIDLGDRAPGNRAQGRGWRGIAQDRAPGAALVALAGLFGWQEQALMLWALWALAETLPMRTLPARA